MPPSPDDKLVGDAVLDFSRGLHSDLPLRHFGEFHNQEKLKAVVEQQKEKVFRNVFDQVWRREREEIVSLFTKLNQRMDNEVTAEWLAKNREHEIQSVFLLQKWVDMLGENFNAALECQLHLYLDMELGSFKNHVERRRQIVTSVFDSIWKPGNAQMQDERKSKLDKQLQVLGDELFDKRQRILESKSVDDGKTLLGEVGAILLERSRQLKSYVVKHQGQASIAVLNGMVEEILDYLLNGKGSALKESQEEIYCKLVEILNGEIKFLTEVQLGKMTAENLVGFAERLEEKLRSCYADNDGDKVHEERDPNDKYQRWTTMQELLKELKENQLESLDLEGNEQNGSIHGRHPEGNNDGNNVPINRGESRQTGRGKGNSVMDTDADSNDPTMISGTATPETVPQSKNHGTLHDRNVAGKITTAARADGGIHHRRSSRLNNSEVFAPTRSSRRKKPRTNAILQEREPTKRIKCVADEPPYPNYEDNVIVQGESMISPDSFKRSLSPRSVRINDGTKRKEAKKKKPKRSKNAISRTTRRDSARKSIPRASFKEVDPNYSCGVCKQKFRERRRLNYHAKFCGMDKTFLCDMCDKGFHRKYNLDRHILVHTGEKPFECPKCPKRFVQKVELQRHIRCHSNENVFICKPCNITFLSRRTLHEHKLANHEGKLPFACSYCDKRYDRMLMLRNHVIIHADERPFKCPKCEACFTRMNNLVHHIRHIHDQEQRTAQKLAYDASIAYLLEETKDESCRDIPVNKINASVVNHVIKKANLLCTGDITVVTTGLSGSS